MKNKFELLLILVIAAVLLMFTGSKNETIKSRVYRLLSESDRIENYDRWAKQHKNEILSLGTEGIDYLLHYPIDSLENEKKRKTGYFIVSCLGVFGEKAIPILKTVVEGKFNHSFDIALKAYFKIADNFPEEEEYLLQQVVHWKKTDSKKFDCAADLLIHSPDLLWPRVEKQPEILCIFSRYFIEEIEISDHFIDWGNWNYFDSILESNTLPFFSNLVLEFLKKEDGICFSKFYQVFDDISLDLPNKEQFEQSIPQIQKKDNSNSLVRTLYNNDPRLLSRAFQKISLSRTPKKLLELFPLDRDEEAVAFLKKYILKTDDLKWYDAACVLANYLNKNDCREFGKELIGKNQKIKGNYLLELAETGCSQFKETANKKRWVKILLPFMISLIPDIHDIEDDLLRFIKGKIYQFKDSVCNEGEDCISRLKDLVETGSVLKQVAALDWLSSFAAVNNVFFMEKLKYNKNPWIKAVCIWILKQRNAYIPHSLILDTISDTNPFLVLLGVEMLDKTHKADFGKLLEGLFVQGDTLYQKEVLKKIEECFGYREMKSCFNRASEEKVSILAKIYFIQKAFENRDIDSITDYFHLDRRPELLCPAAMALFEIDKEKTVKKIIYFMTEGLDYLRDKIKQKKLTEYGFKAIIKTFISILGHSKKKCAIPILDKFSKIYDFNSEGRDALAHFIPIQAPGELEKFKEILAPNHICFYMIKHFQPKYQNWVYNYLKKNPYQALIEFIIESEVKPLFPIIRPLIMKEGLRHYTDEIKKLNPGWAKQEFLWYLRKGNKQVALTALTQLVELPPSEEIDAIMKKKFLDSDEDEKDIACLYFARQGKDFILQYLMQNIKNRKETGYFIKYLKYYPDQKGLKFVIELIEKRVYRVWFDLDVILKEFSKKIPDQLKKYIYHPDIEVRKKIIAAFRGHPDVENWCELKQIIKHPDISLAIWAFDTCKDHFKQEDFRNLKSFYQRLKAESIKIEVLEVISTLKSGEVTTFLNEKSKTEKYIAEYAVLYSLYHDANSLVSFLKQTKNPDLLKSALDRLIEIDKTRGIDMLLDLYINFEKEFKRFKKRKKEIDIFSCETNKIGSSQFPITIKIPRPIKKTALISKITPPLRDKNAWVRFSRTYHLGKTFFYFWTEQYDISLYDDKKICRVIFSEDMKEWGFPISFAEPMRIESPSMMACADGNYLLCYLRCSHMQALIEPRPFFVPFDLKNGFKKGFYPIKTQQSFSYFNVFYFKGNYYIAAVPENRKESRENCFEIYRMSSLENCNQQTIQVQLPEKIYRTVINVYNERVYLHNKGNLYESTDGIVWKKICHFPNYKFHQLLKCDGSQFCAVLGSRKYGFYESYVTFSSDLIHWSTPQYTGLPMSGSYAFHETNLLDLDGTEIKAINLKNLGKDSDNDGLTDREEEVLFTDCNNPDTDKDGIDDFMDLNPIRKPVKKPTESMRIREAVIKEYIGDLGGYGQGDVLIVVSESEETQTFENLNFRVLSFNPIEFRRYADRFGREKGYFFRIHFDKIEFSRDRRSAEVEFSYYFRPLAAAGYRMRLRKVNNEWVIISTGQTWIS
jgi:hypothetical protein